MSTKTRPANIDERDGLPVPLGRILATPGALRALAATDIETALNRHHHGDWGDCSPEDAVENDRSLTTRLRLLSVYHSEASVKFWIITEADRSSTTVLLPEDY